MPSDVQGVERGSAHSTRIYNRGKYCDRDRRIVPCNAVMKVLLQNTAHCNAYDVSTMSCSREFSQPRPRIEAATARIHFNSTRSRRELLAIVTTLIAIPRSQSAAAATAPASALVQAFQEAMSASDPEVPPPSHPHPHPLGMAYGTLCCIISAINQCP